MNSTLQSLFQAINHVEHEYELRSQLVPKLAEYFAAQRSGIFFFDQILSASSSNKNLKKIADVALSVERNPIARYLVERHAPAHEALVTSPKAWRLICPRPDHWHVMAGPIVSEGQLVGVVGCTREKSMPAFDAQDLADVSAVCLHLSVWTTSKRTAKQNGLSLKRNHLTSRELQIADLVASGRTNAEVGAELWITENTVKKALKRMFRKLDVSSRTEMVVQLATDQRQVDSSAHFGSVVTGD
ncbi:Transcriptional regulatory protein LiaR [Acaryochloris thomasi RCC1774]|uniref:Transcriptional regulatory protein LiaR n=1 Tax=Acaryochloris thomasi RCC1774 TaxID=1764569 RepID=A0A2W1JA68_9CYAN|nr:LuxR C-terminal-related transcriptional regulator [Acaryochloris thomasi]PZD71060.1 Transcriptional regulatory protein LiaR [Acaryochloris thomasi RCC1774]